MGTPAPDTTDTLQIKYVRTVQRNDIIYIEAEVDGDKHAFPVPMKEWNERCAVAAQAQPKHKMPGLIVATEIIKQSLALDQDE